MTPMITFVSSVNYKPTPSSTHMPLIRKKLLREPNLETAHLRLRRWERQDLPSFIELCNDPEVMKFFNGLMSANDCFNEIERQEACFDAYGYGLWAVELKETGKFIGAVGIEPTMLAPKGMTARITWKIDRFYWGQNYGYEAGQKIISYAFKKLKAKEVFAQVDMSNARSLRLIQRLGFKQRGDEAHNYYKTKA